MAVTTNFSFLKLIGADSAGYTTINNLIDSIDAILNARIPASADATSVIGRAGSTAGATAPIIAAADGTVLQRSGGALSFAQVNASNISSTYPGHQVVTTTQKNALTGVVTGTMVYDSTLGLVQVWDGTIWASVGAHTTRVGFQQLTTYKDISTSVAATGNVFTSNITFTALAGVTYKFKFYSPYVETSNVNNVKIRVFLTNGSGTSLCHIGQTPLYYTGSSSVGTQIYAEFYLTPGAGVQTYNISAEPTSGVTTGAPRLYGGTGASGGYAPMWFEVLV